MRSFIGHVAGVLNQINPGSTDFEVKVLLANPRRASASGMVVQGRSTPPIRGIRVPASAFTDDNHDAVMVVQNDDTVKTIKVAEVASDGTPLWSRRRSGNARRDERSDELRRRRKGLVSAVKFSLTRLFIQRPTLVFVIVALMIFAGILSTATIVKELYPNVSQPTVTISVSYNGASVTEMRDNIVQPIEQNVGGHDRSADLQLGRAARPSLDHRDF